MTTIERKLASIRRISELRPIENADRIETAVIDGWTVVVKKGEFTVGDLCVYFEIDSWIPHDLASFLTKPGHEPKEFNGVKGQRLRTVKLRGQLSQGLVLPVDKIYDKDIPENYPKYFINSISTTDDPVGCYVAVKENDDVTEHLGIQKWEKPLAACLAGVARGNFPSAIPKTDQERIQNLKRNLEKWVEQNLTWEVTEKLDGSSCTFYLDENGDFHVCSRNLDLKRPDDPNANTFWKAAVKYNVEERMKKWQDAVFEYTGTKRGIALQGEVLASNIQGNQYGISENDVEFYLFDAYETFEKTYCDATNRKSIAAGLGLKHAPVLRIGPLPGHTVEELLTYAEGQSMLNNSKREGVVFKCIEDPSLSFKAISNSWLLDEKE